MRIIYTLHAEKQLRERRIEKSWVEDAIHRPDFTLKEDGKYYVIKRVNGHTLKVVYDRKKYINVITCFFIL